MSGLLELGILDSVLGKMHLTMIAADALRGDDCMSIIAQTMRKIRTYN